MFHLFSLIKRFFGKKKMQSSILGFERKSEPFPLSKKGNERLSQLHPDLQKIIKEYLFYKDLSITEGYRDEKTQNEYKKKGTSNASFGQSPHNYLPSLAVDIYPYPVPTILKNGNKVIDDNSKEWDIQAQLFMEIAKNLGIQIEWGGTWKSLVDKPHFQLGCNNNWKHFISQGN